MLNFRNYEKLDLEFGPGMTLIHGENGKGKSNLLEALYILAIAKSQRASSERELLRRQCNPQKSHTSVSATVQRNRGSVRIQIDLEPDSQPGQGSSEHRESLPFRKHIRVNGAPRSSIELVGEMNAVMFSAQDLELVQGPPPVRRRYMDILISQIDREYLRLLQRYQRVVSQRNHLLKAIRDGRAQSRELDFWDDELVANGKTLTSKRAETIRSLSEISAVIHAELAGGGEDLIIDYRPSINMIEGASDNVLAQSFRKSLASSRQTDVSQGFTTCGPHRDDLQMRLNTMDTKIFGSRGQCRTVVLAMKLAEAQHLKLQRGEEPILLLDDVLSELDLPRRTHLLDKARQYQQCFLTTAETGIITDEFLSNMSQYTVSCGRVKRVELGN